MTDREPRTDRDDFLFGPFHVIPMPIDKDGRGPASDETTVKTLWQIWNAINATVCECPTEREAFWLCDKLNGVTP